MSFGAALLVHENLYRARQLALALARHEIPVAIHLDAKVPAAKAEPFMRELGLHSRIFFTERRDCGWGRWSLVQAELDASAALLERAPEISHVMLLSGSCLPIKPLETCKAFLQRHKGEDFIESFRVGHEPWGAGGLDAERFQMWFPFSYRHQRKRFDLAVALQRRFSIRRRAPQGVTPHLGSQWWCLSRQTLTAIANDPERVRMEAYFKGVWIPDESYFQTMARRHGRSVHSRSLTFNRFDHQGKPTVFYDDHIRQVAQLDGFFIRKVWHGADQLYRHFLSPNLKVPPSVPDIARRFVRDIENAADTRRKAPAGAVHAGRLPPPRETPLPYLLMHVGGLDFSAGPEVRQLGRLLARESSVKDHLLPGNLSHNPAVIAYRPWDFMRNALRNALPATCAITYAPSDLAPILARISGDPNARILHIRNAWLIALADQKTEAAILEEKARAAMVAEVEFLADFSKNMPPAQFSIIDFTAFLENPSQAIADALVHLGLSVDSLSAVELPDRARLEVVVRALRDKGLNLALSEKIANAIPEASLLRVVK
ncbi:MAG TPA: beta-1,6-N-acetylglucosaminyltransferase [Paracoccaceae bacterium]|nr:beta-1,6-N-acetylglucosaminyltransferase [Paracoccaceae bacterium]